MPRVPQEYVISKGSLRNIQLFVNEYPDLVNTKIKDQLTDLAHDDITWLSPLREDDYSEYSDNDFIERIGLSKNEIKLREFWPTKGAHWDALAVGSKGKIILDEAKANLSELKSPPTGATAEASIKLIRSSLSETKTYLGVNNDVDW
jgi:hypothetical protein